MCVVFLLFSAKKIVRLRVDFVFFLMVVCTCGYLLSVDVADCVYTRIVVHVLFIFFGCEIIFFLAFVLVRVKLCLVLCACG